MDKVWATFRTFGVLLGLWVILAVVGIVTGAVPLEGLGVAPARRDAGVADAGPPSDAGPPDGGAEVPVDANAPPPIDQPDAGALADGSVAPGVDPELASPEATAALTRWRVCASSAAEPSLAVAQVFGDARPEVIVGCADGWHVIGLGAEQPARIAVFTAPAPAAEQRARLGQAAVGDVDGDGHPDFVLPLGFETATGASRGGALFWVPGSSFGGIREPVALAPIAAVFAAVGVLDATSGLDVVAMNRTNALAQLPSEAWVFAGGAAPRRLASLATGLDGRVVRIADIDRDGHADVVALARDRVDLHFGDGAGAFPRSHSFALPGAREIALGDLDADGGADLAVLGVGLRWIRAGAIEGMEPRGVDGVPATLRGLQILDVNGDGKLDFVGWDHPRLAVLQHTGEVSFEARTGLTLAGGPFGPRRHVVTDLDADGATDDVVLLGTTATERAPLELVFRLDALDGASISPSETARELPDAPLVLRATLAP